jgi:transposase
MDIAKQVFQLHGADGAGLVVFRKKVARAKVLAFFASHPPCVGAMEACGGAHYWAQEIASLGHVVKLIAPKYIKPFVKRQKNGTANAEAICEAAQRPTMRFVAVKSEVTLANSLVFSARDLLVRQRTQIINALRGHLAEHGWVASKGSAHVAKLIDHLEDPVCQIPEAVRTTLGVMVGSLRTLDIQIHQLDREINKRSPSLSTTNAGVLHRLHGMHQIGWWCRSRHLRAAAAIRRSRPVGSGWTSIISAISSRVACIALISRLSWIAALSVRRE